MPDDGQTPMQRFEDLATKLFSIAKDDAAKAEEIAKEAAEDIITPPEPAKGED